MGQIQKQGIINSIITYIGFVFGFVNVIILYPILFTKEQFGLTRLYNDLGLTFAIFSSFGITNVIPRFLPKYVKENAKDLIPFSLFVVVIGTVILSLLVLIFRQQIFENYCEDNLLFKQYAYLILFMGICNVFYSVLSTYSNCSYNTNIVFFISQLFNRAYPTFLLLLVYFKLFSFPVFIHLFALASLLQLIIIIISLYKNNLLEFDFKISVTTKNLKKTMLVFGGSIFIVLIIDTLSSNLQVFTISDMKGIDITAIFVIASYISQVIQIPQRSISAIAIPVISTAWNENDIDKIRSIYKKSSVNMNIIGLALFLIISLNINTLFHVIGKNYESGINIALFMAIANLIDLSFGINNEIIGTSKFWKFNFITHVCLIAIQIPTNYFFIKHFGAIGAAYSLILSLTVYNTWRMVFLYVKYDMLPFSINSLYVIMYSLILFFLLNYIFGRFNILLFNSFQLNSLFLMAIRTFIVVILFVTPIYKYKVSEEFNGLLNSAFDKFKAITNK